MRLKPKHYIDELIRTGGKYSYAAKMAASFVVAAKFVEAQRSQTVPAAEGVVAQLTALVAASLPAGSGGDAFTSASHRLCRLACGRPANTSS